MTGTKANAMYEWTWSCSSWSDLLRPPKPKSWIRHHRDCQKWKKNNYMCLRKMLSKRLNDTSLKIGEDGKFWVKRNIQIWCVTTYNMYKFIICSTRFVWQKLTVLWWTTFKSSIHLWSYAHCQLPQIVIGGENYVSLLLVSI